MTPIHCCGTMYTVCHATPRHAAPLYHLPRPPSSVPELRRPVFVFAPVGWPPVSFRHNRLRNSPPVAVPWPSPLSLPVEYTQCYTGSGMGSGIWAGAAAAASPKLGVFWGGGFAVWVRCVVCVSLFSSSCISYAEIDLSFSLCALFFACCLVGTGGCGMDGYGVARWKGSREKTKNG